MSVLCTICKILKRVSIKLERKKKCFRGKLHFVLNEIISNNKNKYMLANIQNNESFQSYHICPCIKVDPVYKSTQNRPFFFRKTST